MANSGVCYIESMHLSTDVQTGREDGLADPETARLTLKEMGSEGDTIAHLDGEAINVFGGIPGEEVTAKVFRYRRRRRRKASAMVTEVLKASPHRVAPPCPYFGPCSGCQWQHIKHGHQLTLKRQAVERELWAYPELRSLSVSDALPSRKQFDYRNHARFTIRRQGSLGFINRINRRFVRVDSCMLMSPWINETLAKLQDRCEETSQLSVRYGVNTGEWLVQPSLDSEEVPIETGQTHYGEELLGRRFRIASPSFFQVNTEQAARLIELVKSRLDLTGEETLVDAYAGVGTFAVLLASEVRRVIAIEESESAIRDAAVNAIGLDNLEFRQGKVEDVLGSPDWTPDVVILDPPRAGCQPPALEAVAKWAPRKTVYVSCEPATLARDLSMLVEGGLRVDTVEPVDMFPQTHHVECVATLTPGG